MFRVFSSKYVNESFRTEIRKPLSLPYLGAILLVIVVAVPMFY